MAQIIHIAETSSTNEYIQGILKKEKNDEGLIVWTDFQTAGKGQTGNSWEAEAGKNITMSIVFYPDFVEASSQFILSQFISLALIDVLSNYVNEGLSIKWPNDIYVHDKKIAGILIENVILGRHIDRCIAGIGININQEHFLSDAPNPTSLYQICKKEYLLEEIISQLQQKLFGRYIQICNSEYEQINSDYKKWLYRKNGYHSFFANGETFEAKIKNIRQTGHLLLENINGKEIEFAFKEVQFIL